MTRIYLIRHGETDYNKMGCYCGWTDGSLSAEGLLQAEALKEAFKNIRYDALLTSDLKRASETAEIIARKALKPIHDSRLRELNFGSWEGKTYKEIMEDYKEDWSLWTTDWYKAMPTGGEGVAEMYSRVSSFMEDLLEKYVKNDVVIVGHNGSLRMIMTSLLGFALDKQWCFSFDHGRYSVLDLQEGHCCIRHINII